MIAGKSSRCTLHLLAHGFVAEACPTLIQHPASKTPPTLYPWDQASLNRTGEKCQVRVALACMCTRRLEHPVVIGREGKEIFTAATIRPHRTVRHALDPTSLLSPVIAIFLIKCYPVSSKLPDIGFFKKDLILQPLPVCDVAG